jgi:GR25 family glycosyltransferase involved in LPS biosynthesis
MDNNLIQAIKDYKVKIINVTNNPDSIINKKIKQIYVINLAEDMHKRNYILVLMKKYGINFKLIIVNRPCLNTYNLLCKKTLLSISELGCCLSHLWCLYQQLVNKLENAIIFEDDIILHKDFINKFIQIYNSKPDIDFLLLGAHDFMFSKMNHNYVNDGLYKPDKKSASLYGAHANYYSYEGAKRMFYIRMTEVSFFDKEYMLMFNHFQNSFICYPNLVVSNITSSKLNHEREILSILEKEYYNNCFIQFNFCMYNFIYINFFENLNISPKDDYEYLIEKSIYNRLHDFNKIDEIKKRLVLNFFTVGDIIFILTNQILITPNNLSKKCIGEND